MTVRQLRQLIRETLYSAWKTKGGKRIGDPLQVDANNTDEAGKKAAKEFGANVDPYTIDLEALVTDSDESIRDRIIKLQKLFPDTDIGYPSYPDLSNENVHMELYDKVTRRVLINYIAAKNWFEILPSKTSGLTYAIKPKRIHDALDAIEDKKNLDPNSEALEIFAVAETNLDSSFYDKR